MKTTTLKKISQLQQNPRNIRNICILAHVDHGKTTLADALVASNGIISQRMAGKLRYMDSREDEQVRGITMKSSAITLMYDNGKEEYLINLIDSPGHVDFSSEVSTAVRLCEGAVVVVDVVEGVCPQTHAVLRQAWLENIKPILVLNKIDRLIFELKMETLEAFIHLQQILTQVNLVTSELFTAEVMEKTSQNTTATGGTTDQQSHDWTEEADEQEEKNIYFSPDQGNVIFASAYDGWAFTIGHFAEMFSKKLGINSQVLQKTLWGDFYLNSKTKRIMKGAQSKAKKPLFVQFVLDNLWSVYDAVLVKRDKEMTEKIVKSLNLKISARDMRHNDSRVQLQAITSQWLPVSIAVLSVVVEKLPSPLEMTEEKVEKLMCSQARRLDSLPEETQQLKPIFLSCSPSDETPVIVFVSKMLPVDKKTLPQNRQQPLTEEDLQKRREVARMRHAMRQAGEVTPEETSQTSAVVEADGATALETTESDQPEDGATSSHTTDQVFVAFARVFSGTVRPGQKMYVLGPKHDPAKALQQLQDGCQTSTAGLTLKDLTSNEHITEFIVTNLYLFMGRELETLDSVPAGNVLGIGGLEEHVLKSATIASTVACPAFTDLYLDAAPIVRVAIEPQNPGDMPHLIRGLKLLNQADPCVQVMFQETGEHVIVTAGEVHLQRCLDDLKERYGKIEISASSPIVPFRETVVQPPKVDMVNEEIEDQNNPNVIDRMKDFKDDEEVLGPGLVQIMTPNKQCMVQIRAIPLPAEITDILEENQSLLKTLDQYTTARIMDRSDMQGFKLKHTTKESLRELKVKLENTFLKEGKKWTGTVDQIWAFGPRRVGSNLLLNRIENFNRPSIWNCIEKEKLELKSNLREFDYSIVSGFQLATLTGPLCEEPMRGVCFAIEKWEYLTTQEVEPGRGLISRLTSISSDEELEGLSDIHLTDSVRGDNSQEQKAMEAGCVEAESKEENHVHVCEENVDSEVTEINGSRKNSMSHKREVYGHLSGLLMSIVKDGCRKSFQTSPQRLMAAMYKCTIQCTTEALGKLYAVIGKRNGRIVGEDMREGSQTFIIDAVLPVVESFGFAEELRKKTSGLASPQLVFSHWEVVDVDPFWVPSTEEEIMHYGEKADSANRALIYMNNVRRRKGLKVDEKIVEHAEKQRTLTKMK